MKSQPKALYLLNFISMWECFSYYGMRLLLVLFMVHELHFSDERALGVYAFYITLIEISALIGGVIADRYLGLKQSIILGSFTILLGHLCMSYPQAQISFFLSLGLIVIGTGFFRSNVAAFLGDFYEKNDSRREAGYTLYYTGINIGGFLASIICGIISEVYGWHAAFSLAAFGMLLGNIVLFFGRKILCLEKQDLLSSKMSICGFYLLFAVPICGSLLYFEEVFKFFLPLAIVGMMIYLYKSYVKIQVFKTREFKHFVVYVILLALFYSCEEQLGSSLMFFSERYLDRETSFGILPAASLITLNPLTIIVMGPLLSKLFNRFSMSGYFKIGVGFVLLALAYSGLSISIGLRSESEKIPLYFAIFSIVFISLGELFIGPTVYAVASKLASKESSGLMMGIVTLGFALANFFSGLISQGLSSSKVENSLESYQLGFAGISILAGMIALILLSRSNMSVLERS